VCPWETRHARRGRFPPVLKADLAGAATLERLGWMRIRQAGVPSIDSAASKLSTVQERPERIGIRSDTNPSCAAKLSRESILRSLAAEIVLPLASPGHGGAAPPRAPNSPPVSMLGLPPNGENCLSLRCVGRPTGPMPGASGRPPPRQRRAQSAGRLQSGQSADAVSHGAGWAEAGCALQSRRRVRRLGFRYGPDAGQPRQSGHSAGGDRRADALVSTALRSIRLV
jgi:hypothetical protein